MCLPGLIDRQWGDTLELFMNRACSSVKCNSWGSWAERKHSVSLHFCANPMRVDSDRFNNDVIVESLCYLLFSRMPSIKTIQRSQMFSSMRKKAYRRDVTACRNCILLTIKKDQSHVGRPSHILSPPNQPRNPATLCQILTILRLPSNALLQFPPTPSAPGD